jgi:transposase InsO family protein
VGCTNDLGQVLLISSPASVLVTPREIADQNNRRCSLRATGGRPGDRIGGLPVITAAQPGSRPITHLPVEVLRRPVEPGQYTSVHFGETLSLSGLRPSVGSVGDAYDNALAETTIGLYKNECVRCDSPFRRGPLQALTDVELITADWVSWYNQQRLMHRLGRIPPAEAEAHYYAQRVAGRPTGSQRPEGA